MTSKTIIRTVKILLSVSLIALSSCTHDKLDKSEDSAEIPLGKPAYSFDGKRANALTIAKADPATGDHWMARVTRIQEKPESFFDNDPWLIQAYSENTSLEDQLANRILILHLLDTLSTFRATAVVNADESSDSVRSSFGLNPPRYAIQWQAWDKTGQKLKTYQTEIGNPVDLKQGNETYGTFPPSRKIYKVDGAAIAMLDYVKDFLSLRQSQLSPLTSDDVDEIVIENGCGKKLLYAQRDGDRWTNQNHKLWKKDVAGFLERMTHLRIKTFIDSQTQSDPLRNRLTSASQLKVILKDRYGKPTTFRFAQTADHQVIADVSSRGKAVFDLFPEALDHLNP
jgi:hypothetical protein